MDTRRQGWNFHVTTELSTTDRITITSLANTLARRWLVRRPIRFKIHDYVFMAGGNKWRDQTTRLIISFFPAGNTRLTRWRAKREPCSLVNRRWRCEQVTRLPVEYNYCLIRIIWMVTREKFLTKCSFSKMK